MNRIPYLWANHLQAQYISNPNNSELPIEVVKPTSIGYRMYANGQLLWETTLPDIVYGVSDSSQGTYAILEPADHAFPGRSVGTILTGEGTVSLSILSENSRYSIDMRTSLPSNNTGLGSYSGGSGRGTMSMADMSNVAGNGNRIEGVSCNAIDGGYQNIMTDSQYSTILGGYMNNMQSARYAIASGFRIRSRHDNSVTCGIYNSPDNAIFSVGAGFPWIFDIIFYSNAISVDFDGNCSSGGFIPEEGDYAIMYESQLEHKIDVGVTVILEDGYIRPCREDEVPVGVISDTAGIVLKDAQLHWHGKYITEDVEVDDTVPVTRPVQKTIEEDVYNEQKGRWYRVKRVITEEEQVYDQVDVYDESGQVVRQRSIPRVEKVGTKVAKNRCINPQWDKSRKYIPRADRPEWNVVGILGRCKVRRDQPVNPRWILLERGETYNIYLIR